MAENFSVFSLCAALAQTSCLAGAGHSCLYGVMVLRLKWPAISHPWLKSALLLAAVCALLLAGRYFIDRQWDVPRLGFSALLFFFFAIFLNRWCAAWAALSLEGLLWNVSYVKTKATGEPLLGRDLLEVGQGLALTAYIDWDIIGFAVGLVAAVSLGLWYRPSFRKRRLLPGLVLCGIVGCQFDTSGRYALETQRWLSKTLDTRYVFYNFRENVKQNGILAHLVLSAESMHVPKPGQHDFYSVQLPPLAQPANPDLVVVMCESCYTSRDDKLPTALQQLTQRGFVHARAISPVYGGGTADAEYEALTGLSSLSLPGIDFQNFSSRYSEQSATLASELDSAGYLTTGMHNYHGSFYKRAEVYPKFGFQQSRFIDRMYWDRKAGWPLDKSMYDVALQNYRSAAPEQKQFMFLVTVSTHGPFIPNNDSGIGQYQTRLAAAVRDLENFEAALFKLARQRQRPLVLVVFGDHKPALNEEFVARGILPQSMFELDQKGALAFKNQLSGAEQKLRGDVPLMIKANRPELAAQLAGELNDKPLFCLPASLSRQTSPTSPFFNAVAARCERNEGFYVEGLWWRHVFPEALYAERLFAS